MSTQTGWASAGLDRVAAALASARARTRFVTACSATRAAAAVLSVCCASACARVGVALDASSGRLQATRRGCGANSRAHAESVRGSARELRGTWLSAPTWRCAWSLQGEAV
eukprot:772019-Pleurochrysis_carterae.AAC.5